MGMMIQRFIATFLAFSACYSIAFAQPKPPSPVAGKKAPAQENVEQSDGIEAQIDKLVERITAAESEVERQKTRVTAAESEVERQKTQNAELQNKVKELGEKIENVETNGDEMLDNQGEEEFTPKLDIYGFFDTDFYYLDFEKQTMTASLMASKPSFIVNQFNIYFAAQMEKYLSALAELRFSFLPNGLDENYDVPALGSEYKRTSTVTMSPVDLEMLTLHSVSIERVLLTWKPYDFFSISAGRFITPYGIWVTDHAPTVIIPLRRPQFITWVVIPPAQTGLQVFGRVYPLDHTYFDYILTLSNGRGPADAIYDLDDNKGLGLRLKATYEREHGSASLGGYLYWGTYTDVIKGVKEGAATPGNSLNMSTIETERYQELIGTLDLTIEIYGLRLQSEFCSQYNHYTIRPIRMIQLVNLKDPTGAYMPDNISWFIYGMAAYKIPIDIGGQQTALTPFTLYEYDMIDSIFPRMRMRTFRFGLNFKPSPYVTIKYESASMRLDAPPTPFMGKMVTKYWSHAGQVAVSF